MGINTTGDGTGNRGGMGSGDLGAGIAEGNVEISKNRERSQEGSGKVLVGLTADLGIENEPFRGGYEGEGLRETVRSENRRCMTGEQQEQFV